MESIVTVTPNPAIDVSTAVDELVPIRKLRCAAARRDAGGGGINVARVVRRLGGDVSALYPAGGETGDVLKRLVTQDGVRSVPITIGGETREDFTVLDRKSGNQYRFVLPGPTLVEREWVACLDALQAMTELPRFVVCSGSLPPGVPDDFYARVARIAKARGAKVILDTSGNPLVAALDEGVYLVKPNLRELQELAHEPIADEHSQIAAALGLIESRRAEIVAVTLAERGALLITGARALRIGSPGVTLVSGVGAGDSFVGGMVSALARGESSSEAFRWGVAAGSAAVLNPGTELCHAPDVKRLFGQIIPEPV
jgi:6-phosphofructokinase 2